MIRDVINQAVWKKLAFSILLYPNTYQKIIKAITSIIELVIPITIIYLDIPLVFHFLGDLINSSSTLSYGIPIWEKS